MNEMTTATATAPSSDASMTGLITGIIADGQKLVAQQLDLIKVEVREDVRKTLSSLTIVAAGVGVLGMGLLLLSFMVVYLLAASFPQMQLWLCFLIVGGALSVLGAVLAGATLYQFNHMSPLPEQSLNALKENVQWKMNPK